MLNTELILLHNVLFFNILIVLQFDIIYGRKGYRHGSILNLQNEKGLFHNLLKVLEMKLKLPVKKHLVTYQNQENQAQEDHPG